MSDSAYRQKMLNYAQNGIGGFIIFGGELEAVRLFVDELQQAAPITLFIASDIERGTAQQLNGAAPMPCQMAVASAIKGSGQTALKLLHQNLDALTAEASYAGINMPLIPVADVNNNPANPIICTRAFSDDPAFCAELCAEYVKSIENNGLISCPKHFPGHGDTSVDSHLLLPVINKTMHHMQETELIPFESALKAGARSIMVGHLLVPAFNDQPATLSNAVVRYIRDSIGFNGLLMTDALNMSALNDYGNIHVKCLKAGLDILLHPDDPDAAVHELENAIMSGELPLERIDQALDRIIRVKSDLSSEKIHKPDFISNINSAQELAQLSFALLKGEWPRDISGWTIVLAGDEDGISKKVFTKYFSRVLDINCAEAVSGSVIIAISTKVAAWRGRSGIDQSAKTRIKEVIKNAESAAVVSFGSPYVLAGFGEADALAAAYGYDDWIQELFAQHIINGSEFCGRLPVSITASKAEG